VTPPAALARAGPDARADSWDVVGGPPFLIVPGIDGSGSTHWQSHWERALPGAERVDQTDWSRPDLGRWTARLADAVARRPGAVLVAHSLGCALVAHFAALTGGGDVAVALLVASADVDQDPLASRVLTGFAPMPCRKLAFESVVVASRNDPFVTFERAKALAGVLGAAVADVGHAGHINIESVHGPWIEGLAYLRELNSARRDTAVELR